MCADFQWMTSLKVRKDVRITTEMIILTFLINIPNSRLSLTFLPEFWDDIENSLRLYRVFVNLLMSLKGKPQKVYSRLFRDIHKCEGFHVNMVNTSNSQSSVIMCTWTRVHLLLYLKACNQIDEIILWYENSETVLWYSYFPHYCNEIWGWTYVSFSLDVINKKPG